jgi:hypothetical protein
MRRRLWPSISLVSRRVELFGEDDKRRGLGTEAVGDLHDQLVGGVELSGFKCTDALAENPAGFGKLIGAHAPLLAQQLDGSSKDAQVGLFVVALHQEKSPKWGEVSLM